MDDRTFVGRRRQLEPNACISMSLIGPKRPFREAVECPLWMAPAMQEVNSDGGMVGCSLLSGLLMQSTVTAGPDGVREQSPILLLRL